MRASRSPRLLFLVWLALPASAAEDPPAGHWEGAVQFPAGRKLEVRVDLARDRAGAWTGTIDLPAQQAQDHPLGDIRVDGQDVWFGMPGFPGNTFFQMRLSEDGRTLTGEFTQAGRILPCRLERTLDTSRILAGLGEFVNQALRDWETPGLALAVVKGDTVLLAEGYGVRDAGKRLAVTRDTVFAIGSATKAFTATLLGLLVDEGRIAWDTPVARYLPTFRLKDEAARERLTPRDLVTHRSGLPRHDFVWYNAPLSRREIFDRLAFLEPSADFRARFQYQNLMFMAAGHLAEEVAGAPWETLVQQRLFEPLGMAASNVSVEETRKAADYALPYQEGEGGLKEIPFRNLDAVGPAGSINSSAADMARWLRFNLSGGRLGEKRLVSEQALAEIHRPQVVVGDGGRDPEILGTSYAMGWMVDTYRGHLRLQHGGNIDGFSAMVALLPRDQVGVAVLTNRGGTPLPEVVARTVADRLLELPALDWSGRLKTRVDTARKAGEKARGKLDLLRKAGTRPTHAWEEYAGEYEHPAYGRVTVAVERGGGLRGTFHAIPMKLVHWHYDTFHALPEDPALAQERSLLAHFETSTRGEVERLLLPIEVQAPEIVFVKKPPARLSDPAFLKAVEGVFELADNPAVAVTVTRRGPALSAVLPGQPSYVLEPFLGTEYRLKGLTGFSIRFLPDARGAVDEALVIQPDGVYAARRKP
jgi:CubicO group peptidase (beta-lactamase class C family)